MNLRSHPYESYRASNGEWVDQTPSEWQEQRVKDLFRLVTDKAPVDNDHELLSLYASIGVRPRKDLEARGNKASSTDGYWLVKKGDIVVNKLLAWMGSVGLSEYDGVTSPAYDVLRKTSKLVDVRYFSYLFRTEIAKQIFKRNSRGIMDMRLRLYFDKLGAITVPVPPFSTQQAIATYIDTKTAQIDRQIDLLGQKATQYGKLKQSLINETVTRGLDKSVPMKDSGVEWIGKIPDHWEIKRVRDAAKIINGYPFDADLFDLFVGTPLIRIRDLNESVANTFYKGKVVKAAVVTSADVLIGMDGDFNVGRWYGVGEALLNQRVCCVRGKNGFLTRFIEYSLPNPLRRINALTNATTVKHLSSNQVEKVFLPFPKESNELFDILEYLDKKTGEIDRAVTAINNQIDKLKDLRKALINDVVTGKIKVVSEGQAV